MPFSCITSATAAISESVFFEVSLRITESSVRSGMKSEKIFTCLTWPAITASVIDARLEHRDAPCPSWPSETQCSAAPRASAAATRAGSASSLMATTVTGRPCACAASRTRKGNRPLPAISPSGSAWASTLLVRDDRVVGPARRVRRSTTPREEVRMKSTR